MLVSRKNLSLIHLIAGVRPVGSDRAAEPFHEGIVFFRFSGLLCKLDEPFAESLIERPLLGSSEVASPFDEVFVGTEGDILHTKRVYTGFVYTATLLSG